MAARVQEVSGIVGSGSLQGGERGVLELQLADESALRLELDASLAPMLLAAVANIGSTCESARRQRYGSEAVASSMVPPSLLRVAAWTAGTALLESGNVVVVLQFELPGGAKLSFPLTPDAADNVAAAMRRLTATIAQGAAHRPQ